DEPVQEREVVGAVSVHDDDEVAARGLHPAKTGRAIAADRLVHDTRASLLGVRPGPVRRAVVAHDDLAAVAEALERVMGLPDDGRDAGALVQAGNDDRYVGTVRHPVSGERRGATGRIRIDPKAPRNGAM